MPETRPDLLYIHSDQHSPFVLGCAGDKAARTRNLDRLAARGPDQLHGCVQRPVGDHSANHPRNPGCDHGELTGTQGCQRVALQNSGIGQSAYQVHDEDVTAAAVGFLDRLDGAEPFNLTIGFMLPHQPYVARRADYDVFEGKVSPPRIAEPFGDALHPYIRQWREQCGIEEVTDDETVRAHNRPTMPSSAPGPSTPTRPRRTSGTSIRRSSIWNDSAGSAHAGRGPRPTMDGEAATVTVRDKRRERREA
jgi:hypothetical protein